MFFRIFGSAEFRHRHIYIAPCAYITFFAETNRFFCQRAIFEFRYAHCFNKYLYKGKT